MRIRERRIEIRHSWDFGTLGKGREVRVHGILGFLEKEAESSCKIS